MDWILKLFLTTFFRTGCLTVTTAGGSRFMVGNDTGRPAPVKFLTKAAQWRLLLDPELALGEIYMDGELVVDTGSIADVLEITLGQPDAEPRWSRLQLSARALLRRYHQFNLRQRSERNVAAHYDLDERPAGSFLIRTCSTVAPIVSN